MKHRYNVNCNISFLLGLIYATIILIKVPSVHFWPKTGLQGEKESLLGTVSLLPSPGIGRKYTNNTNVIFKRRDPSRSVIQFSGPVTLTATKNSFLLPNNRIGSYPCKISMRQIRKLISGRNYTCKPSLKLGIH